MLIGGDDELKANRCPCNRRRPPVPKHTERPIRYPPSHKDYVALNASSSLLCHVNEIANGHRNQEPPRSVDSKDGHVTTPLQCGLVPHYVQKPVSSIFQYKHANITSNIVCLLRLAMGWQRRVGFRESAAVFEKITQGGRHSRGEGTAESSRLQEASPTHHRKGNSGILITYHFILIFT